MKQSRILVILCLVMLMQSVFVSALTYSDALGISTTAQTLSSVSLTADASAPAEATVSWTSVCSAAATCLLGGATSAVSLTSSSGTNVPISNVFTLENEAIYDFAGTTLTLLDSKVSDDGVYQAYLYLGGGAFYLLNTAGDTVNSFRTFSPAAPNIGFTDGEILNVESDGDVNIIAENDGVATDGFGTFQISSTGTANIARIFNAATGLNAYLGIQGDTNTEKTRFQSGSFISGTGFAFAGQIAVGAPGQYAGLVGFLSTALVESANSRSYNDAGVANDVVFSVTNDGSEFFFAGSVGDDFYMTNNPFNSNDDWDNRFDPTAGTTAKFTNVAATDAVYIGGDSDSGNRAVFGIFDAVRGATTASYQTPTGVNDVFDVQPGLNDAGGFGGANTNGGGSNTYYSVYEFDNAGNINSQAGYGVFGAQGNNIALVPNGNNVALAQLFVAGYQNANNKKFIQGFRIDPGLDPLLFIIMPAIGGGVPVAAAGAAAADDEVYYTTASSSSSLFAGFDASFSGTVPEFSAGTLLLALLASGFLMMFVMRRNQ